MDIVLEKAVFPIDGSLDNRAVSIKFMQHMLTVGFLTERGKFPKKRCH